MKYSDVQLGMKVVPHSKSIGCPIDQSIVISSMKTTRKPYLIICHQHAVDKQWGVDKFLLNTHDSLNGDYFRSSDFEPYIEEGE